MTAVLMIMLLFSYYS